MQRLYPNAVRYLHIREWPLEFVWMRDLRKWLSDVL